MTTDASIQSPSDLATQARLAALGERRAGSKGDDRPAAGKRRRRHAATGGRILAGSLSVSVALGLMATMAGVDSGTTVAESPAQQSPEPVVIVVRSSTDPTSTATASRTVAAPPVTASTATPVTSSQAS